MTGGPRIIPRDELSPSMRHEMAEHVREQCRAHIVLGGTSYECRRKTTRGHGVDRAHDGIHDAFAEHVDSGAVRW